MGPLGFIACLLQAFGPLLVLFVLYYRRLPQLTLILIIGGFFFVVATMIGALVWQIKGVADSQIAIVVSTVLSQEIFRYVFFRVIKQTSRGFASKGISLYMSCYGPCPIAFAAGAGFGLVQVIMVFGSLASLNIHDMAGTLYIPTCSLVPYLFLQAVQSSLIIFVNAFWMVIAFPSYIKLHRKTGEGDNDATPSEKRASVIAIASVLVLHLSGCLSTIANKESGCGVALIGELVVFIVSGLGAYFMTKSWFRPLPKFTFVPRETDGQEMQTIDNAVRVPPATETEAQRTDNAVRVPHAPETEAKAEAADE